MLAIKKRHELTRPITAGMVAFTVGLAGSIAYLNAATPLSNLVFHKQEPQKTSQVEAAAPDKATGVDTTNDSAQSATTPTAQPLPVSSRTPPATQVDSALTTQQTAVPVVEQQTAPVATPAPTEEATEPKTDPVTGLLNAVGNLLGL